MSYPKKDWWGPALQSFFGHDNDKDLIKVGFLVTRVIYVYDIIVK